MANYLKKYLVNLNNLKTIERISSGAFGTVYLVQDKKTKQKYAAKMIHSEAEQSKTLINREIGIMIRMQHPTIIKFYGYSLTDFEGKDHVTLLLQFAKNGSLANFLKNVRSGLADHMYDNTARQKILVGIARGMMYLHKHNVIHRDLKPANILLDDDLQPHITDFGASRFYSSGQSNNHTQSVGTSIYMAPEVIEGNKYNGKADVYSFGILMYEVVTDSIPYEDFQKGKISLFQFNMKVVSEDYRPQFKEPIKESIRSLIEQCWSKNPNNRPTFEEIFNRLAFNIEESVYDVFEKDNETPKYYLDDVDQNELLFYIDDINVDSINNVSLSSSPDPSPSLSLEQFDKLKEKVEALENENKKMADEQTKLIQLVQQQSNEIMLLKNALKDKSGNEPEETSKPATGKTLSSLRPIRKPTGTKIPYVKNKEFEGIISYIKKNLNISDAINITASSVDTQVKGNSLSSIIEYNNKAAKFRTNDIENSWICFDFKSHRVILTNYTIKSRDRGTTSNPKSWVIEGSNNCNGWVILDERNDCNALNECSIVHTFDLSHQTNKEYRYLRMRQTDRNWYAKISFTLTLTYIEFYGELL